MIAKKEKALSETTWRKQTAEEQVDELKRSKKELMAQIEESQLHLTLELENNSRLKQATEAEIKKKNELAMLLENILKEKEFFIKR